MMLNTQSITSILPSIVKHHPLRYPPSSSSSLKSIFNYKSLRCSVSLAPSQPQSSTTIPTATKPSPAEVSRTIMELSSVATFSTQQQVEESSWPLAVGVRYAVDPQQGTPIVCLTASHHHFASDNSNYRSSLNVQLEQCGSRTTQCTIQGILHRPHDQFLLKKFQSLWEKRFGEQANTDFIHILDVQRVLQMDNFMENGVWVSCSDYRLATADPLRDFAEHLVHEINTHNMEDVLRFCNVYIDSDVQVSKAKMVWVDRLGFDIHIYSPENDVFEARIPFPREVTNEKGAKSSFNGMSQLAWEVEKNYHPLDFERVKQLKKVASKVQ